MVLYLSCLGNVEGYVELLGSVPVLKSIHKLNKVGESLCKDLKPIKQIHNVTFVRTFIYCNIDEYEMNNGLPKVTDIEGYIAQYLSQRIRDEYERLQYNINQ